MFLEWLWQVCWGLRKSCLKSSQVRTGFMGKEEKLSEVEPSSDRFHGQGGKAVRSRAKFRPVSQKTMKSCPKSTQVRTGFMGKEEKLSKVEPSSDRFHRKRGKAVQSRAKFRQVSLAMKKSCQKSRQVQTGFTENEEKLSEVNTVSNNL